MYVMEEGPAADPWPPPGTAAEAGEEAGGATSGAGAAAELRAGGAASAGGRSPGGGARPKPASGVGSPPGVTTAAWAGAHLVRTAAHAAFTAHGRACSAQERTDRLNTTWCTGRLVGWLVVKFGCKLFVT